MPTLQREKKRVRGFTLIELLIVTAIIGILAALMIPNYALSMSRAQQKATMTAMHSYGNYLGIYMTDNFGKIPNCNTDIVCIVNELNSLPYKAAVAEIDAWGQNYEFTTTSWPSLTNYELRSYGADHVKGLYFRRTSPASAVQLDLLVRDGVLVLD